MRKSLRKVVFDKPLLSEDEALVADAIVRDFWVLFGARDVELTSLVLLRANDVVVSYLVERKLEEAVWKAGPIVADKDAQPTAKQTVDLMEALGKAQERLRKAMKEFEEVLVSAGGPTGVGFADRVKPVLKKAEGVLKDALEHGAARAADEAEEGSLSPEWEQAESCAG